MNRTVLVPLLMCVLVLLGASSSGAAKFNARVDVGQSAPDFHDLPGTDGKQHSLEDYREARVLVLVFTCNHCPVARGYEPMMKELVREFTGKVALVAISVSTLPADGLDEMKKRAIAGGFNFDYLHDASQAVGTAYGASATPQVFVLDQDRKIAYMGAFDDSQGRGIPARAYLRDAVESLLEGKPPPTLESRPYGCPIVYD